MDSQKIKPYVGMYPDKAGGVLQNQAMFNQQDQDSIDSFDLDFFAAEKSPKSIIENPRHLSFENKINLNRSEAHLNEDGNQES